jgi:hypothetical protein
LVEVPPVAAAADIVAESKLVVLAVVLVDEVADEEESVAVESIETDEFVTGAESVNVVVEESVVGAGAT